MRRLATELGAELALGAHDPVELLDDVHGHADRPALVRDRARDRLPDPPGRVRRELEALAVVELLGGADETDRALLDEVEEGQALVAIPLRDRDDEAEVRLHHRLLRAVVAALDALRELDLLGRRQERDLADVLEEELQRVGRDLRLGLDLGLGLVHVGVDDGDLRLVEGGIEVVELRGLQLELVERERELVGIDLARSVSDLQEALALVAGEDLLDRRSSGSALRFVSGQTAPLPRRPSHGSYSCGGRQSRARTGSRASLADRLEVALRLARERRSRLRLRGEAELALGALDPAGPEEEHAEMEAHRRLVGVRAGEGAEPAEGPRGRVLVERAHGARNLRLDVVRVPARGLVERARCGHRTTDALQADSVQELLTHTAVPLPPRATPRAGEPAAGRRSRRARRTTG